MQTDYDRDHTAEQYREAKQHPWRTRVETYSFMKLIGDLRGRTVLDLACGAGHFTRRLRRSGAAKVVGLDISARMIALAREEEAREPLGIEYRVEDAGALAPEPEFDLAVAAWLLVYARDRAELARLCRGIASRLRPGGRFVTYTTNPEVYAFRSPPDFRKYGFTMMLGERAFEGAPIRFTHFLGDSTLEIENYYLPVAAYEAALRDAGFAAVTFHAPELSPAPDGRDDRAYWADFLTYPTALMIDCRRA